MPKDIWAWYDANSLLLSFFFFLTYNYMHIYYLFVMVLIFFLLGCPSHFQA